MEMAKSEKKKWVFASRFRRNAFGWRSQPAITRVKQAVSEIKKVARGDPILAAQGAVLFLKKLSPALAQVDSSSGAIGTAVNHAIRDLVTRMALSPEKDLRGHFHGTSACLSALFFAGRYAEVVEILAVESFWPYKRWAVRALAAMGKKAEAIRTAEACRGPWANDQDIDSLCEEVLLASALVDEAYRRYGLTANRAGTHLAWFRAVAKKYADKAASEILSDLVESTPGDEGKWFAAAKSAGLYDEAVRLALRTPCDPRTLTRAARDFAEKNPVFATETGLAALYWLVQGYGYEITGADVWAAYANTIKAAEQNGTADSTKERVRQLVGKETSGQRFVTEVLGRELGLR
ncbi:MAG: hypothetical protein ACYSUN_12635 [Planctomycetota bacterium]|jgi:hypothetical protein